MTKFEFNLLFFIKIYIFVIKKLFLEKQIKLNFFKIILIIHLKIKIILPKKEIF